MTTKSPPKINETESQLPNSFGNQTKTEKRPKLTLGLKKRSAQTQSQEFSQVTINSPPKLILGLRKKANIIQPQGEGETKTTDVKKRSEFGLGLKKKHEFRPQVDIPHKISKLKHSAISMPKTIGRIEVNIKISELPNWVESIKNGWQQFCINAEGQIVQMKVRPKTWHKLLEANEKYSMWVASITGDIGHRIKNGFELLEPVIQIYEKNSIKSEKYDENQEK